MAASSWVDTELASASAVAVKVRTRALSDAYLSDALGGWRRLKADNLRMENVAEHHFREAALLAGRPELTLRAGDALHLAIVVDRGFGLTALDRNLIAAARFLGVRAEAILPGS